MAKCEEHKKSHVSNYTAIAFPQTRWSLPISDDHRYFPPYFNFPSEFPYSDATIFLIL